jgi:hypothetical protein
MMLCALVAATLATGPEVAAMKVRRLGRTGLKVSVIGVGTWQLGGEWGGASPNRSWTGCSDARGSSA